MERLTTLHRRGASILAVDYSGVTDPREALDLIWASSAQIVARPLGSVRALMSIRDAHITSATVAALP